MSPVLPLSDGSSPGSGFSSQSPTPVLPLSEGSSVGGGSTLPPPPEPLPPSSSVYPGGGGFGLSVLSIFPELLSTGFSGNIGTDGLSIGGNISEGVVGSTGFVIIGLSFSTLSVEVFVSSTILSTVFG